MILAVEVKIVFSCPQSRAELRCMLVLPALSMNQYDMSPSV